MEPIRINQRLVIPPSEVLLRATRSGGPGGQHANTSSTRVELTWNPRTSTSLSDRRRDLILSRLASRLDSEGTLRLVSDTHRSQHRNRQDVLDRFAALIAEALRPVKERKKTRPTRASKERRLSAKKRRGQVKKLRGKVGRDDP
ncbi:MAG TPA: alternative ribosome rescue aminoacyl-tRNA hydrolase ArfB [Longimicrobiales bacterium]|nr:alternative ribosome rescue aminoacyl-tRNA hydrolase ArfB [Longimicrobiales bacterium]